MGVLLRTTSDPASLAAPVRAAVQKIDQNLPLFRVRTLTTALEKQCWFFSAFGTLFSVFALTGLLMGSVGIYAVVAQATARRTREIGIRMALGATAGNIARLVLFRGPPSCSADWSLDYAVLSPRPNFSTKSVF